MVLGQSDEKYDTMRSILVQEAPLVAAKHCCKTWLRLVKLREATNISALHTPWAWSSSWWSWTPW